MEFDLNVSHEMDRCFSRTKANTETFSYIGRSEKDPIWQLTKAKFEPSQSLQNQKLKFYQNSQSSFWKGHWLFIAVKIQEKKRQEKGYLTLQYVKTGDLNQKPRQGMNIMQNTWVQCPQIHKIIQGINFTPTFTSWTCKINYVTTV